MKRTILIKDPTTGYSRKCTGIEDQPIQTDIDDIFGEKTDVIDLAKYQFAHDIVDWETATSGKGFFRYSGAKQESFCPFEEISDFQEKDEAYLEQIYNVKERLVVEYVN